MAKYKEKRVTGDLKESGALGEARMPNGRDVMTEYSINMDGVEMPSIVEGMHPADLNYLRETMQVPRDLEAVAVRSAKKRMSQGKSPFWNEEQDKPKKKYKKGGPVVRGHGCEVKGKTKGRMV